MAALGHAELAFTNGDQSGGSQDPEGRRFCDLRALPELVVEPVRRVEAIQAAGTNERLCLGQLDRWSCVQGHEGSCTCRARDGAGYGDRENQPDAAHCPHLDNRRNVPFRHPLTGVGLIVLS